MAVSATRAYDVSRTRVTLFRNEASAQSLRSPSCADAAGVL
jgi:hypothetical protein